MAALGGQLFGIAQIKLLFARDEQRFHAGAAKQLQRGFPQSLLIVGRVGVPRSVSDQ